ncbi:MAG: tetratricopeptide repeat protein [Phycisphaerales bacterium]
MRRCGLAPVTRGLPSAARRQLDRAIALSQAGDHRAARDVLLTILRAHTSNPDVCQSLAAVSAALGDLPTAQFHLERLSALDPARATDARLGLAAILYNNNRHGAAVNAYRATITHDPACAEAHEGLADSLAAQGSHDLAEDALRAGLAALPDHPALAAALGAALVNQGRAHDAVDLLERAARAHPGHPSPASMRCHALNYVCGSAEGSDPGARTATDTRILAAGRAYQAAITSAINEKLPPPPAPSDPDRRLRVGLLSPDLRTHSVAFFLEPILEHRRSAGGKDETDGGFEVIAYSTGAASDETTQRLRAHTDGWRDVATPANEDLAAHIRRDAIDILIELSGHTTGHRLAGVSMRPAPIQIGFLGYPATTGLDAVDARIVDSITDPPGAESQSVERLIRLDPCFLAYRPPPDTPEPALPEAGGPIVFGCFNVAAKLSPEVLATWSRVLARMPGSRLMLKNAAATRPAIRARLESSLSAAGIDAAVVDWHGWTPTIAEHLACHRRVHVALDTFPYNGTTTTCEALWMGVPVVSLCGDRHAGRVGASILSSVGETSAGSEEEYVETAVALAGDIERLSAMRRGLRERMRESPLLDHVGAAERFWGMLRRMWRERAGRGIIN